MYLVFGGINRARMLHSTGVFYFYLLGCKAMVEKRSGECGLSLGKLRPRRQNSPTLIPSDLRDQLAMSSEADFSFP